MLEVEQTIWIAAARERVWQALTDPKWLNEWWAPMVWTISSLETGAEVTFGDGTFLSVATIEILEPPSTFGLAWKPDTAWPEIERHDIPPRTVYVLEEHDGGTRVTVTESGFESVPETLRQRRIDMSTRGYRQVLIGLKDVFEGKDSTV